MKVLVVGAHGHTGKIVVSLLANHEHHEAYAMIRDENQADQMRELGASGIRVADLEKDVSEVLDGMDALIFAAGSGSKTGPEKTITVDQEGAKKLVDLAREKGLQHYVMLSSIGADSPYGKIKHYHEAKGKADRYLQESGVPYTIVRPGRLTHEPATGKIELVASFGGRDRVEGRSIPRADVARVLVSSLDIHNVKNKTFEILSGNTDIEEAMRNFQSS